jgi:hypothetical protein
VAELLRCGSAALGHYTLDDFRQKWLVVIREPAIQIGRVALPMMMTGRSATFCRAS